MNHPYKGVMSLCLYIVSIVGTLGVGAHSVAFGLFWCGCCAFHGI